MATAGPESVATRKRSDGAMVRLITPVLDSMTVEEADAKLQERQGRLQRRSCRPMCPTETGSEGLRCAS